MPWTLVASSMSGSGIAEIENATSRNIANMLGRTNTVGFTVPTSSPLTSQLASTNLLIDAWDGAVHRFRGRVISYNRVAGEGNRSMAVVAADPSWIFQKRLIGKSAAGYIQGNIMDRGQIAKDLLDIVNSEAPMGVRVGTLPYLSGSTSNYSSGPFKPLSEAIADLSAGVYGFDWTIEPLRGVPGVYGDWRAVPLLGGHNPDVLFHYVEGGGGNMKSITDTVDKSTQATRVYHWTEFGPDATGVPTVTSATDEALNDIILTDGFYEDVAVAQLYDTGLRQQLVDAHVQMRRHPRRTITFQPQDYDPTDPAGVPRFGTDYGLGDIVRARAEDEHGLWFDGYFRVYGWTAMPSNEGLETGDLLLVAEGGSG